MSLSGQAFIVAEVSTVNLITEPFADFSKDVGGHYAHKGDSEELGEERGVGADDSDAGQPEAGAALGEKGLGSDHEVGYSESHRVRPQQVSWLQGVGEVCSFTTETIHQAVSIGS